MVLFDEDPVTLIRQTTANFHTSSDLSSISRISSSLSTLRSARNLRLTSQSSTLKTLSRRLHHTAQTHSSLLNTHDPSTHASQILSLDTEKFRIAKGASDLEIEGERLATELRGLRTTLQRLEDGGEEGGRESGDSEDEVVLKLRVYRSLGIDAEVDEGVGDGACGRAVVRGRKGEADVRVVKVDGSMDRFFYAQHFWSGL